MKSKEPRYKTLHIIVSTALLQEKKKEITLLLKTQLFAKLPLSFVVQ